LLAHGRWFSPGTPASSTTKTGRHDIAEILLKVALKHQKSNIKKYQIRILFNLYIYINYTFTKLAFILFWYHFLSVNLKFVIHQHD
jgi:hypothetical protein